MRVVGVLRIREAISEGAASTGGAPINAAESSVGKKEAPLRKSFFFLTKKELLSERAKFFFSKLKKSKTNLPSHSGPQQSVVLAVVGKEVADPSSLFQSRLYSGQKTERRNCEFSDLYKVDSDLTLER